MSGICCAVDPPKVTLLNEFYDKVREDAGDNRLLTENFLTEQYNDERINAAIQTALNNNDFSPLWRAANNYPKLFELALVKTKMWHGYTELKVYVSPQNSYQGLPQTILQIANQWQPYSGITFVLTNDQAQAHIRVAINGNGIHYSEIGTDAIGINQNQPTMRLGISGFGTMPTISRAVLHEFGHALGCIHEHQSPVAGIQWNVPAVLRAYALQGWNPQQVNHNVIQPLSQNITNSVYDPDSIMHYPIDQSLLISGNGVPWNTILSQMDMDFMRRAYA